MNTALTTASTSIDTVRELRSTSEEDTLPTVLPNLEKRIESLEEDLQQQKSENFSFEDRNSLLIPTVVQQLEIKDPPKRENSKETSMSVNAYEDILLGPLAQFLATSAKIGGDVATQADFVKKAFE